MSFNDIIEQKSAVDILQEEIESERINHAYLLLGKDGVGKRSLAFQFARALLCEEADNDSCDQCINCQKIDHYNHPDVKYIEIAEGANKLKIDQIREIQKEISYKPYETDYKIYIIDDAEEMTPQAANSLLKTLEEPPSYAVIILLVEEINRLLPTVISRCQHIRLSNIPRKKIRQELLDEGIDNNRSELLARIARGSLGRALELNENDQFLEYRTNLYDFLKDLYKMDTVNIFGQAEEMQDLIKNNFPLFDLLSDWYRDIIIYKKGNQEEIINSDYRKGIKEQAEIYTINELLKIIDLLQEYKGYIEKNVRKDLTIQVLLLKIRAKRL